MTWWFPSLSFNEDTILSAQHHQACDKIPNCWHWDQSLLSYPYIFATTKRKLCFSTTNPQVWYVKVCQYAFHANAVDTCPCPHRSPGPNVIVNVYIYSGNGIKETWMISTMWTMYSYRESVECYSVVGSEQVIGYVWLLLRPPADPPAHILLSYIILCYSQ